MSIQHYNRIYEYIDEYLNLIYGFYAKHVVAYPITYYNLNVDETIWEDDQIFGGAYEETGDLSGIKRNKILMLPVYYMEDITTAFDAQETGYIKENNTTFVIPSEYNFVPYPHDIIKMSQSVLRPTNDTYPIYKVTGVEISVNTDKRFWRLRCETLESSTTADVDAQVVGNYAFVDYDKKIHTIEDAQYITRLLVKDERLVDVKKTEFYDSRTGYYFVEPTGP